jgi:ABC-2 type transport system permease protein
MSGPLGTPDAGTLSPPARGAAGSIYDLGYRGYEGPRLGRRHAIRALLIHTFRICYGLGLSARAKLPAIILGGIAVIPAIITIGVLALARQLGEAGGPVESANPIRHDSYFGIMTTLVFLFCAAQVPEIMGRDQRHNVLSLYFSRALRRTDYALARYTGVVIGLLVFLLLPQLIIMLGLVLSASDVGAELGDELQLVPPIVGQALLMSLLLGAISTAVASFTPRRLYATVAIVVFLAVTPIITNVLVELGTEGVLRILVLLSPGDVLEATNNFLFDNGETTRVLRAVDLDGPVYIAAALAGTVACVLVLVRRYQRISA